MEVGAVGMWSLLYWKSQLICHDNWKPLCLMGFMWSQFRNPQVFGLFLGHGLWVLWDIYCFCLPTFDTIKGIFDTLMCECVFKYPDERSIGCIFYKSNLSQCYIVKKIPDILLVRLLRLWHLFTTLINVFTCLANPGEISLKCMCGRLQCSKLMAHFEK